MLRRTSPLEQNDPPTGNVKPLHHHALPADPGLDRGALAARFAGLITIAVAGLPLWWRLDADPTLWRDPATLAGGGSLLVFALLFWWQSCEGDRPTWLVYPALALQTTIAIGYATIDRSGLGGVLLVLVASLLVGPVSTRVAIAWLVLQNLGFAAIMALAGQLSERLLPLVAFGGFQVFAFYTSWVAHREREGRQTLARLHAELEATHHLLASSSRSSERIRIARELHDAVGHHLTALSLRLEATRHTGGETREEHLEAAREVVRSLLSEVREVVSELRESPTIDLVGAIEGLARGYGPAASLGGPQIHVALPADLGVEDPEHAVVVLRAAQELLTNAVRHARARTIQLRLSRVGNVLRLDVEDDGRGAAILERGNGLRGLEERVGALGGRLELDSRGKAGLRATVELPATAASELP